MVRRTVEPTETTSDSSRFGRRNGMETEGDDHRGYGDRRDDIGEYDVIVPKGRTRRKRTKK